MPSAAILGLYNNTGVPSRSRGILMQDLHNTDMKSLVSILRRDPFSPGYWDAAKHAINNLPHHLRSSSLSHLSSSEDRAGKVKPGHLCKGHSGLKAGLVYDIWDYVRFEFDKGVGHTLYPVIMHGGLNPSQELKIRQLEPVLRMWHSDYTIHASTPQGLEPIDAGEKWKFQESGCPACILSRIGVDKDVVFALLVGIVARYSNRQIGNRNDLRSKRVKWTRYWVKAFPGGEGAVDDAWDLGQEIRRIRWNLRTYIREWRGPGFYGFLTLPQVPPQPQPQPQPQSQTEPQPQRPPRSRSPDSDITFDISPPHDPTPNPANPTPGGSTAHIATTTDRSSVIGYDISTLLPPPAFNRSQSTVAPTRSSSIYSRTTYGTPNPIPAPSAPPLPPRLRPPLRNHQARHHRPPFSIASAASQTSLDTELAYSPIHSVALPQTQIRTHDVPVSQGQICLSPRASMHSLHARIETAQTEWGDRSDAGSFDTNEWEQEAHDARTHAPQTHTSLYPAPLSRKSSMSRFTSVAGSTIDIEAEQKGEFLRLPTPNHKSMYGGFRDGMGRSGYDASSLSHAHATDGVSGRDGDEEVYDVSPLGSDASDAESEGSIESWTEGGGGLRDLVKRGLHGG
ncbi:hypothetical protein K505DRAFT_421811 [Melanomma pulvis-pyrius CBS 109.77]|uniref:Uncharacterized protein n=1 Tax=Melanomma pulvis-pyrius CBS 109.77 TaxID=1314802 RepID=A0A6A6WTA9_9PLEO|nr:hypothetical protein K505DRAFT_421811 [Melanomma pulvis-pyrius CBS 109.77]